MVHFLHLWNYNHFIKIKFIFYRLALLWYHTIVCPFFNVNGNTSKKSIEEAAKILEEEIEYKDSALFLFFKGRVERLKVVLIFNI